MYNHPIRKIAGLTVLYSIIIIGIFVLQFRSDSAISKKFGLLKVSLEQDIDNKGNTTLRDFMKVSFKGISFTADQNSPLVLTMVDESEKNLALASWTQPDEKSFKFDFSDDVSLIFSATDDSETASLKIDAVLPEQAQFLSLPYKPEQNYSVTKTEEELAFAGENSLYKMISLSSAEDRVIFSHSSASLAYNYQEPPKPAPVQAEPAKPEVFSLAMIGSGSQHKQNYEANIAKAKSGFVSLVQKELAEGKIPSEQIIIAYIAEMGKNKNYTKAVESIPSSFKSNSKRTYLSAPFFNSLVAMNQTLSSDTDRYLVTARNAITNGSLSVFENSHTVPFMKRNESGKTGASLSKIPAQAKSFQPDVLQSAAIINTYSSLKKAGSILAQNMAPQIDACLNKIIASTTMKDGNIVLKNEGKDLNFNEAITVSYALINYSGAVSKTEYANYGYMIANTAFAMNAAITNSQFAEIYPCIAPENTFYPHFEVAGKSSDEIIWAWTSAEEITYKETADKTEGTITVKFPAGSSHYIILRNIKPFVDIEIYGVSFHTDARFENYNSSGYVYNESTKSLLLKSRHKSETETIRLTYKRKPAPKPEPPAAPAVPEQTAENQDVAESEASVTE